MTDHYFELVMVKTSYYEGKTNTALSSFSLIHSFNKAMPISDTDGKCHMDWRNLKT